jgi:hypothetical protein
MPTSGLAAHLSQTPRTSANLRLRRKWARKSRESDPTREKLQTFPRMIAQDAREKTARIPRTTFAVIPAARNS